MVDALKHPSQVTEILIRYIFNPEDTPKKFTHTLNDYTFNINEPTQKKFHDFFGTN